MLRRLPPLESLRVLEACVRHANFTRAAAELGVTPAAVSLRIRDLEAELGVALFRRAGPRVAATASGAALAQATAGALRTLHTAIDACRPGSDTLRVTAPPTFATHWLAPRLAAYHRLADAMPIRLDVSTEMRAADAFDVAVRTGLGAWPSLVASPLMPVEGSPMLSPALAAGRRLSAPADLLSLPLLPHPDWPRWFQAQGVAARDLKFYASDHSTSDLDASVALTGAAVGMLAPNMFSRLIREGRLVQPFAATVRGPEKHYLLTRPEDAREPVRAFCVWLRDAAREDAAVGSPS